MEATTAFILCGGLGSRLGELTLKTPKSLIPLDGVPMIFYEISYLINVCSVKRIVFCLGRCHEVFSDFIEYCNRRYPNVKFIPFVESHAGGTGTVILEALFSLYYNSPSMTEKSIKTNEHIYILNGDIFCFSKDFNSYGLKLPAKSELAKALSNKTSAGFIKCVSVNDPSRYGLIKIDSNTNKILEFIEKPKDFNLEEQAVNANKSGKFYINGGIYCLSTNALYQFAVNYGNFQPGAVVVTGLVSLMDNSLRVPVDISVSIERDIFPYLVRNFNLYSSELTSDIWADCGTIIEYGRINELVKAYREQNFLIIDYA